jgi:uncharacterized surface protein with fasciclin (FAS1) repeats
MSMRKPVLLLAILIVSIAVAAPTFAQERPSIPEWLTNDGRFATLLSAVEAAGLSDALSDDGPITVLAPTDDAFAAALADLGMTADELMADTETLTSILQYHIIPDRYFFRDLTSGPTLDTALEGEAVTFSLEDGVFTATGVNILDTDNLASNGIVHVLEDGVLLPSAVQEAAAANRAHIRVAPFSPDAGSVDVYLNGQLSALTEVTFGTVSDWIEIPAGTLNVSFAPTGGTTSRGTGNSIAAGSWVTVAAMGTAEAQRMMVRFIVEDFSPIREGVARVSFLHAVEGAPVVDILANGELLVATLGYPRSLGNNDGFDTREVGAATYDLQLVPTGATEPVLLERTDVPLVSGMNYLIAATGTPTNMQLVIVPTDVAAMMAPAS